MKNIKKLTAVLLCLVMLLSFAACGKKDDGTDSTGESTQTTQTAEDKIQSLDKVGLSLKKLYQANKIESLMEKYDTITVESEMSNGSSYICQVFKYDGELAFAEKNSGVVEGFIKGFDFTVEDDHVKAYRDVDELEEGEELDEDDLITELFDNKELVSAGEADGLYKLKSLSEDEEKKGVRYFYFDKESLSLTKVTYENSVGNTESTVVTYNAELEDFSKKIVDSFDAELKTVHIKGELADDSSVTSIDVKLQLPADWEYVPSGVEHLDFSMDEAFTNDYVYPGHGEDYTIYISNIFDDTETGKK